MIRTLALFILLAACKGEDKPKPPPPPPGLTDKAKEALEAAEVAAQKAKETAEAAKDKASSIAKDVKDRASEVIDNSTTLRNALTVIDDKVTKAVDALNRADTDDARRVAQAALDKLRAEKQAIEKQLEAIRNAP